MATKRSGQRRPLDGASERPSVGSVTGPQAAAASCQAHTSTRGCADMGKLSEKERVAQLSMYQRRWDPKLLAAKSRSHWAATAFAFCQFPIFDGMKLLVIVWLVLEGSSAGEAGWIFLARNTGFLLASPFAGRLIDSTSTAQKKMVLMCAIFFAVVLNIALFWTHGLAFMIVKNFIEGMATAFFVPTRNAIALGIDKDDFASKTARNRLAETAGGSITFALAAVVGYFVYPSLEHVFIIFQLTLGVLAVASVAFISDYGFDLFELKR